MTEDMTFTDADLAALAAADSAAFRLLEILMLRRLLGEARAEIAQLQAAWESEMERGGSA
jgi:hypothetical protein